MVYEPIIRNRYSEPPFTEGDFSARNFDEDLNEYHLPLSRTQLSNLYGKGVIQGLEVQGEIGTSQIKIEPGAAIDEQGHLIILSADGQADLGTSPEGEDHDEVDVPVLLELDQLIEADITDYYLTIQFSEILRFEVGPLGRYDHAPWIRLQPKTDEDSKDLDSRAIILAELQVSADGKLQNIIASSRTLIRNITGEIQVSRVDYNKQSITQVPGGKIRAIASGQLQITVPQTESEIRFSQEDGDKFSKLEFNANDIRLGDRVKISDKLEIEADTQVGNLSVTDIQSTELTVESKAQLQGDVDIGGDLNILGNEVKITGSLTSGHSSGRLEIKDDLRILSESNPAILRLQSTGGFGSGRLEFWSDPPGSSSEWRPAYIESLDAIPGQYGGGLGFYVNGIGKENKTKSQEVMRLVNGRVGIGTTNPKARLEVQGGAIMPAAGNSENAGLFFPKDPFGGSSDRAWLRYYAREGEAATLELGISNDRNDHIALMPSGNVGVGLNNPSSKLHVNGTVRANAFSGPLNASNLNSGTVNLDRLPSNMMEVKRFSNIGDDANYNTGYDTSRWICTIAGFISGSGDINENDSGRIIQVFMEARSGRWYIRSDFRTHNRRENWTVWVLAIRTKIATLK